MYLIIDIGNTDTKIAVMDNYDIKKIIRISNAAPNNNNKLEMLKKYSFNEIFISSVESKQLSCLKEFFSKLNCNIKLLNYKYVENIIKLNIEKKETAGIDRLINVAGAFLKFKKDSIIVDFGTATKIDVIEKDGLFQGGIILPGIFTGVNNMINDCEKIPDFNYVPPKSIIGKKTVDCICSGMYYGNLFMVKGLIDKIQIEFNKKFFLIATGGLSKLFKSEELFDYIDEYFTLEAIARCVLY
jgi:type III pantothenate kinase